MFNDLREFIKKADELGECQLIEGVDWDLEIGAIGDLKSVLPESPLLMFDKIKGCAPGYRVVSNIATSQRRIALAYGLPLEAKGIELGRAFRDRIKEGIKYIPPVEVKTGPVKENVLVGDDVDLYKFPSPKWRELDGGRYIGTGTAVISRDPDTGWVNLGTYRIQVHDKNIVTMSLVPGHHGYIIASKYWAKGLSCPMAVCCGEAPLLFAAASSMIPYGVSEYDWVGGWQKKAVEVTKGVTTDLPIPATAEIVLECEVPPPGVGETRPEGPFGEAKGYYAGGVRPKSALKVNAILHRNNPIILGAPPSALRRVMTVGESMYLAAEFWNELDKQLPGVKGVWVIEEGAGHQLMVISLKQMYGGHAKQAALLAGGTLVTAYGNKYIIIVDDDIDPSNISEVLWAIGTRSKPKEIDVIDGCWGSWNDPGLTPEQREKNDRTHSTGIIFACKPFQWMNEFPPAIKTSPELEKKVREKFPNLFTSGK